MTVKVSCGFGHIYKKEIFNGKLIFLYNVLSLPSTNYHPHYEKDSKKIAFPHQVLTYETLCNTISLSSVV